MRQEVALNRFHALLKKKIGPSRMKYTVSVIVVESMPMHMNICFGKWLRSLTMRK